MGTDAEHHGVLLFCRRNLTKSDVHMDIVNSSNAPNNKDNNFKTTETTMLRGNQNQLLPFPSFNNSFHNRKSETDSKELSKTVAESMGLYMNAAREADFSFSQQGTAGGQGSQEKLYPLCGRAIEDSQSKMTGSPKMKAPPALFPPGAQYPMMPLRSVVWALLQCPLHWPPLFHAALMGLDPRLVPPDTTWCRLLPAPPSLTLIVRHWLLPVKT